MSPWLPEATVAIEDRRYWEHGALDYQGIARALYQDIAQGHIVQGGSTITQELVRNLYIGNPQRTVSRKVKEACLAEKLFERIGGRYGKGARSHILAAYLNSACPYGCPAMPCLTGPGACKDNPNGTSGGKSCQR